MGEVSSDDHPIGVEVMRLDMGKAFGEILYGIGIENGNRIDVNIRNVHQFHRLLPLAEFVATLPLACGMVMTATVKEIALAVFRKMTTKDARMKSGRHTASS